MSQKRNYNENEVKEDIENIFLKLFYYEKTKSLKLKNLAEVSTWRGN